MDPQSNLPVALAKLPHHHPINCSQQLNVSSTSSFDKNCHLFLEPSVSHSSVLDQQNHNLSVAEKEFLLWHCRLGHISSKHLQWFMKFRCNPKMHHISIQCIFAKRANASTCQPPLPASCEIARAKRRQNNAIPTRHNQELTIRANDLNPGDCVSIE
jgi:hypothetical protein